jgi:hypothetical protein
MRKWEEVADDGRDRVAAPEQVATPKIEGSEDCAEDKRDDRRAQIQATVGLNQPSGSTNGQEFLKEAADLALSVDEMNLQNPVAQVAVLIG